MSASSQLIPMHKDPIVYTIAVLLVFALWILFGGCRDSQDPPPTLDERLQGAWERNWITFSDTYLFHAGSMDGCVSIPGQPIHCYINSYSTQGDTLTVLALPSKVITRAVVSFPDDSTCVLDWIGGVQYFLKRL